MMSTIGYRKYEGRRSGTLLKIKTFYDAEALVTGYVAGKGRNKGVTGALKCKMASGKVGLIIMLSSIDHSWFFADENGFLALQCWNWPYR